jgi:hypothetical protein
VRFSAALIIHHKGFVMAAMSDETDQAENGRLAHGIACFLAHALQDTSVRVSLPKTCGSFAVESPFWWYRGRERWITINWLT